MNYCLPSNQIGNYVPSGGGSGNYSTRNIDCVTLDADTVTCKYLTIDGVDVNTNLQNIVTATQHQSASPSLTTFTGNMDVDQVYTTTLLTNNIQAPTGTLTINSPVVSTSSITSSTSINVNNTTATTGTVPVGSFMASSQTSGTTVIYLGKDITTANNALALTYNYSTSPSNYAQLSLTFSTAGPKIYSTYVDIPSSLTVKGNPINPRVPGTLTTTTGAGPFSFTWLNVYSNIRKVIMNLTDVSVVDGVTNNCPVISVGSGNQYLTSTANTYIGATWGNNAASTIQWDKPGGIPIWNVWTLDYTKIKISGSIEFTYGGTSGTQQIWSVKGMLVSTYSGNYYCNLSGTVYMSSLYPVLTSIQLRKYQSNFASGNVNILYY